MAQTIEIIIKSPRRLSWDEIKLEVKIRAHSPIIPGKSRGDLVEYTMTSFQYTVKSVFLRGYSYRTLISTEGTIEIIKQEIPAGCEISIRNL